MLVSRYLAGAHSNWPTNINYSVHRHRSYLCGFLLGRVRHVVDGALESDLYVSVSQLLVDVSDHVDSGADELLGLFVHGDLVGWVSGSSESDSSSGDNGWEDKVFQNGIVDGSQGSVSWSHLSGVGLDSLGDDGSLTNDEGGNALLLLDLDQELDDVLLGVSERWEWHGDQNSLLATLLDGELVSRGNSNVSELVLQLRVRGSLVLNDLGDLLLELGWGFLR